MKLPHLNLSIVAVLATIVLLSPRVHSAQNASKTPPKPAAPAVTNAPPPKSVFMQPNGPLEGRDPFYPHSTYPYTHGAPVTPVVTNVPVPVVVDVDLKLNGISGTPDHRLAMINGHTFETGEEAEVHSPSGRVQVRCLEIRADGVSVLVNGRRRELHLRLGL